MRKPGTKTSRNTLVKLYVSIIGLVNLTLCAPSYADNALPQSGFTTGSLKQLDREIDAELKKWDIPGATLCVARDGKILTERGYGFADKESKLIVQPDSLFRIGSLSKSLTAIAALKLSESNAISLDSKPFALLKLRPSVHRNIIPDARLQDITVRHLLNCSAGWDDTIGDPVFGNEAREASQYSPSLRPTAEAIVSFWIARPLLFEPGSRYAYANISYIALGLLIEKIAKRPYSQFVTESVLLPIGMTKTVPGKTIDRQPGEVRYYSKEGTGNSLLPNKKGIVSHAYGANYYLEGMTATAGWLSTAPDLVKLGTALQAPDTRSKLLSTNSFKLMLARPSYISAFSDEEYFGMGWEVKRDKNEDVLEYSRHGSLAGCMALIACRRDGVVWAACFNSRPLDYINAREEIKTVINKQLSNLVKTNLKQTNEISKGKV